jgi:hypothetical protein
MILKQINVYCIFLHVHFKFILFYINKNSKEKESEPHSIESKLNKFSKYACININIYIYIYLLYLYIV